MRHFEFIDLHIISIFPRETKYVIVFCICPLWAIFGTTDSLPWRRKRQSICGQQGSLTLHSTISNYNGMYETQFETIWCIIIYDLSTLKLCFSNPRWFGHFWWWHKCSCRRSLDSSQLVFCIWNFARWLYVVSAYIHFNHRPLQEHLVLQMLRVTTNRIE